MKYFVKELGINLPIKNQAKLIKEITIKIKIYFFTETIKDRPNFGFLLLKPSVAIDTAIPVSKEPNTTVRTILV
ncbi:MAG: hypothetical protein AB1472_00155 [Candidatus Omnitrophota bacterium]